MKPIKVFVYTVACILGDMLVTMATM